MEHHSPFAALLLITLLAVFVPIVVSRIGVGVRLPIVVGEILAGIVIGQSGLDLVQRTEILDFLAEFGFTFLMFLSGLEISFDTLASTDDHRVRGSRWRAPVPLASLSFVLTVLLATGVSFAITSFELAQSPFLMGLILSTTSLGIVVPVLKERELTVNLYGQTLLISALINDFCTLLLLSLAIAIISTGGLSLDLMLFMVLLAGFVAAAKVGQWVTRVPLLSHILKELSYATAQIQVRGAFALMVTWVVLAEGLGVEIILGAFLAGAIVSLSSRGEDHGLREKLDAIGYGFFIPIFFIMVGARFDLGALLNSPSALLLVLLLLMTAYAVKVLPALLFRTLFSWREALAAGLLLSSRLSLIIAASAIALENGLITTATNSAIILVAVVTCTLSPVLFNRLLPPVERQERKGVIILGTDQLAELLGGRLRQDGEVVTFIGRHSGYLELLRKTGHNVVKEYPSDEEVLQKAGAASARALIAVSNAPDLVLEVCRLARNHFGIPIVIARADDPELVRNLQQMQVQVVQPAMAMALALEGALHFPSAFDMLLDKSDEVELEDIPLKNVALAGLQLRQIRLPGNALVLGIRRQGEGEVVVPHGDTRLRQGDILMLLGSHDALRMARGWLERQ